MATLWFKQAEDSKPEYAGEKLKANKAKADLIKKSKRSLAPHIKVEVSKKAAKGEKEPEPSERLMKLSAKIAEFRENFKAERERRRTSLSMYNVKGGAGLVAQIYSITGRWTYHLKNYKPLQVDVRKKAQYDVFNKLWLRYDINGCGKLNYSDFEKLKDDVGFSWSDCPSVDDVDPTRSGVIQFEDVARWWFSKEADLTTTAKRSFSEMTQIMANAKERTNAKILERYHKRQRFSKKFRKERAQRRKTIEKTKKRKFILEISTAGGPAKKRRIEYDVTDYKPVEIDAANLKQVDLVWKKYDKEGTGSITQEDFLKLCKEMGTEPKDKEMGEGNVVFENFVKWWFDLKSPNGNGHETKKKAKETKLLTNEQVKEIRQKFARKFAEKSKEVKNLVKNSPMPKRRGRKSANVDIYSKKEGGVKKVSYDITNYTPGFVPRGLETQESHLDLIWKDFEKQGTGKLSREQFEKFVESFGSKVEDANVLSSLQDKDGFITWERFDAWWFSKEKGVVPIAPPAPKEGNKEKVDTIRKSVKATADKLKEKYNLASDAELKKRRVQYSAKKETERAKFRETRAANSPKKGERKKRNQFSVDIFAKNSGEEIQHFSFVA